MTSGSDPANGGEPRGRGATAAAAGALIAALLTTFATALLLTAAAPVAAAQTAASAGYVACLGCVEHEAMRSRWHRPFVMELGVAGLTMITHFQVEKAARRQGLCESDVLIRSPLADAGCHAYSPQRAWLIEAPLEVVAFTSPAWGLERRGHPRWAMLLEAVPIVYHAWSAHATIHAIHQWQRQQFLYFGPSAVKP